MVEPPLTPTEGGVRAAPLATTAVAGTGPTSQGAAGPDPTSQGAAGQTPEGDMRVYLAPFYHSERGAARRLRLLAETPSTLLFARNIDWARAFAGLEGQSRIELAEGQRQAVQAALAHKVSVLTGGPRLGDILTRRAGPPPPVEYGLHHRPAPPPRRLVPPLR